MKTITTPHGKVLVDESAEIKEGEMGYNIHDTRFDICTTLNKESIQEHWDKVIYSINFSIHKDVAMVIVEDEIEKEAGILYKKYCDDNKIDYHLLDSSVFYLGYKGRAAQQKGIYSEDDLRKAFNAGERYGKQVSMKGNIDEYIQSLNQEPIE